MSPENREFSSRTILWSKALSSNIIAVAAFAATAAPSAPAEASFSTFPNSENLRNEDDTDAVGFGAFVVGTGTLSLSTKSISSIVTGSSVILEFFGPIDTLILVRKELEVFGDEEGTREVGGEWNFERLTCWIRLERGDGARSTGSGGVMVVREVLERLLSSVLVLLSSRESESLSPSPSPSESANDFRCWWEKKVSFYWSGFTMLWIGSD